MPVQKRPKSRLSSAKTASVERRRSYHSPLREQQSNDTRLRIVAAGADLARKLPSWDWRAMTFKAVGARAHMNERTVRRYFATERALRDAIQQRLFQECGVDFDRLELANFAAAATQIQRYLLGFASASIESADPGLTAMDRDRRASLLEAVARATPAWTPADRLIAAATLDFFWTPMNFERLTSVWQLDQHSVDELIQWSVSLLLDAIKGGRRPRA